LAIYANKNAYQTAIANIKITARRIQTSINLISEDTVINVKPSDDLVIQLNLTDLNNGIPIKGATVRYSWGLGQGELLDTDNDGIYETTLSNIPVGSYQFVITVSNGSDDYQFERFSITINSIPSESENKLFKVLTIIFITIGIGLIAIFILYYQVLKYPKPVRRIRKFKKNIRKAIPVEKIISMDDAFKKAILEELSETAEYLQPPAKRFEKVLNKREPTTEISKETKEKQKPKREIHVKKLEIKETKETKETKESPKGKREIAIKMLETIKKESPKGKSEILVKKLETKVTKEEKLEVKKAQKLLKDKKT